MAKVVKEFSESGSSRYGTLPWAKWLDGQIWQLTFGEDFSTSLRSFAAYVHQAAGRRGLKAKTKIISPDTVQIQAITEPR